MDRLTERDPYWLGEEFWTAAREPDEEKIDAVYERLMKYEDTGLTPERCAELAKADQEGRLVKLPCKPNDIYWHRNYDTGGVELNIELHGASETPEYREIDACAYWE